MSDIPRHTSLGQYKSSQDSDAKKHGQSERVSALLKTELGRGDGVPEKHGVTNRSSAASIPISLSNTLSNGSSTTGTTGSLGDTLGGSGSLSMQDRIAAQQRVASLLARGKDGNNENNNNTVYKATPATTTTTTVTTTGGQRPIDSIRTHSIVNNTSINSNTNTNTNNTHSITSPQRVPVKAITRTSPAQPPLLQPSVMKQELPLQHTQPPNQPTNNTKSPIIPEVPSQQPTMASTAPKPTNSASTPSIIPMSMNTSTNSNNNATIVHTQTLPSPSILTLFFESGRKALLYCHVRPQLPASAHHANRIPAHFSVFLICALPNSSTSLDQPLCLPLPVTYPLQVTQNNAAIPAPNLNVDAKTFRSVQPFSLIPLLARDPLSAVPLRSGDTILLLSSTTGKALAVARSGSGEFNPVLLQSPLTQGADVSSQKLAPEAVWVVSCPQKRHGQVLRAADPILFKSSFGHYLVPTLFTSQFQLNTGMADAVKGPVPPSVSTNTTASSLSLVPFVPSIFWYYSPLQTSISHVTTFVPPTSVAKIHSIAEKNNLLLSTTQIPLCESLQNALLGFASECFEPVVVKLPHTEVLSLFTQTSTAGTANVIQAAQKGQIANPSAELNTKVELVQVCVFRPTRHISALDEAHVTFILNLANMLLQLKSEATVRILPQMGVVSQAFAASLQAYQRDCAVLFGTLDSKLALFTTLSLRTALTNLHNLTTKIVQLLVDPMKLWTQLHPQHEASTQTQMNRVFSGSHLISLLYLVAFSNTDPQYRNTFEKMLKSCWRAYSVLLTNWVHKGMQEDTYSEFLLKFPELPQYDHNEITTMSLADRLKVERDKVPIFLRDCEEHVAQAGIHQFLLRTMKWPMCDLENLDALGAYTSQNAITLSLSRVKQTVNQHSVKMYLEKTRLFERIHVIHQMFFMSQGEVITDFLVHALPELSQDHLVASFSKTKESLDLSLRSSSLYAHPFINTVHLSRTAALHDAEVVNQIDTITLDFDLTYPVSLVLGVQSLGMYQKIFKQLLLHRYARTQLVSSFKEFQNFKILHLRLALANSNGLRQRMIHVVTSVEQYLISCLVDILSVEQMRDLQAATSIYDLCSIHQAFLQKCMKRCMLDNSVILEPLMKAISYCVLFADNMKRFVQSIDPTSEEMSAALHAFETQTRLVQRQRGVPETSLTENHRRAVRTELKARKVAQILHHAHYLEMVNRFTSSFDQKMRTFIKLAQQHAKHHNDVQLRDLLLRQNYNGYFSEHQE